MGASVSALGPRESRARTCEVLAASLCTTARSVADEYRVSGREKRDSGGDKTAYAQTKRVASPKLRRRDPETVSICYVDRFKTRVPPSTQRSRLTPVCQPDRATQQLNPHSPSHPHPPSAHAAASTRARSHNLPGARSKHGPTLHTPPLWAQFLNQRFGANPIPSSTTSTTPRPRPRSATCPRTS